MSRSEAGAPNLSQLIEEAMLAVGEDIRVSIPGVVASVSKGRASITPAVSRKGAAEADPTISGVPLCWPACGSGRLSLPVSATDDALLVFCDRNIEGWDGAGGGKVAEAADNRTHDLTDAMALPISLSDPVSGRADDVSLSRDSETTGRAELRLGKGDLTETPGVGVSPGAAKVALGVSRVSGTVETIQPAGAALYSGPAEVIDLLIDLCDALVNATPLANTTRVGGSYPVVLFGTAANTVAAVRDKLKMIKGSLG